jgi:hypothetical protein
VGGGGTTWAKRDGKAKKDTRYMRAKKRGYAYYSREGENKRAKGLKLREGLERYRMGKGVIAISFRPRPNNGCHNSWQVSDESPVASKRTETCM